MKLSHIETAKGLEKIVMRLYEMTATNAWVRQGFLAAKVSSCNIEE